MQPPSVTDGSSALFCRKQCESQAVQAMLKQGGLVSPGIQLPILG